MPLLNIIAEGDASFPILTRKADASFAALANLRTMANNHNVSVHIVLTDTRVWRVVDFRRELMPKRFGSLWLRLEVVRCRIELMFPVDGFKSVKR